MARFSSKEKARAMLRDAIISLCRESIPHKEEIAVDGLLGITVDQKEVFLVTIHEMLGGGQIKKTRHSDAPMGLTVKSVEGNSSMFYSDGEEKSILSRKRKFRSSNMPATKRLLLANGSSLGTATVGKQPELETVNIMGENVEIKQEKPDSEDENNSDPGDWQLCVDQTSNDDVLANEVLEMSGEHLSSFSSLAGTTYGRRSSQLRFHEFSQECGTHRPHLIPPTARRSHPQKRCRVCYRQGLRKESRYCCPVCPGYPGLCVVPCFEMYHADRTYQSNLGFNLQEVDANFDITKALGLSTKSHMVVKQDSLGRRTLVSTGEHKTVIENEYVGPDEVEQFYADLQMADEDYDDDDLDRSMSENLESDTERVSDAVEQEPEGQDEEPEHIVLSEEIQRQIQQVTECVNEEGNEEIREDTNEEVEANEDINVSAPSEESPEDEPSKESLPEGEDQDSPPEDDTQIETIEIIPYENKEESENVAVEALRLENLIESIQQEAPVRVSRPIITSTSATIPNTRAMVARAISAKPAISVSSGMVTKTLSPQKIRIISDISQLPPKVISSSKLRLQTRLSSASQLPTKVLSASQLSTKVLSASQLPTKVISASQLPSKVISPSQLQTRVLSSSQPPTKGISPSQLQARVLSASQPPIKGISPSQLQTKVLSASQPPIKGISPSQLQTKVLSASQPPIKGISPSQLQTRIISSPQSSSQLQTKVISSPQLPTNVISSSQLQTRVISSPQLQSRMISASPISGQRTTIKVSPSSFTAHKVDGTKIQMVSAKPGGSNVITLPAGALASGKSTTIRIPSAGGATKTYMITKTASGEIKKMPIILKAVPAGKLQQSGMTTRTLARPVTSSMVGGKSLIKTTVPQQLMIVPKQEPPSPPAQPEEEQRNDDGEEDEGEDPTIDLVPTATSLSTQVLKVLHR